MSSLNLNGYPKTFIHSSRRSPAVAPTSTPEWRAVAVIPYVQGVSECLRLVQTPLQIRVCFKPFLTLRQMLSKPKDQVPNLQQSGVVYSIHCACCPKVYIGQTGLVYILNSRLDCLWECLSTLSILIDRVVLL